MTEVRFEELLGLLLDDDMSCDQLDELVEIVAADPLKLRRLREHLMLSDRLSQYDDKMRDEQERRPLVVGEACRAGRANFIANHMECLS